MTPSEKIVADLSRSSFLSFWSFPNPRGKKNKELCDILVVCEPDIIIFSVKDISVKRSENYDVDYERWKRRAIHESIDQIYGAERIICLRDEIFLKDGTTVINLPDKGIRKIYRVAVAFGGIEDYPITTLPQQPDKFVHVFDERSVNTVLKELDTIADFINYLEAKEKYFNNSDRISRTIVMGEEDFLAYYLLNGLCVDEEHDFLIVSDMWEPYSQSEEYRQYKNQIKNSYLWDEIIEMFYNDFTSGNLINELSRREMELAIRQMNKENRFDRAALSKAFTDIIENTSDSKKIAARLVTTNSPSKTTGYVFLARPHSDRDSRIKELGLRCFVARSLRQDLTTIIGIARNIYIEGEGTAFDLHYLHMEEWTEELHSHADRIKEELGYFRNPEFKLMKSNSNT
jgi:hypothetical protein